MMNKPLITARELKDFRLGISVTQEELANSLRINWATVNRLEKGHNKMSVLNYRNFMGFCKENDKELYGKLMKRNG